MTHRADTAIPADDPARKLTLAQPDETSHIGLVGAPANPCGRQRRKVATVSSTALHLAADLRLIAMTSRKCFLS